MVFSYSVTCFLRLTKLLLFGLDLYSAPLELTSTASVYGLESTGNRLCVREKSAHPVVELSGSVSFFAPPSSLHPLQPLRTGCASVLVILNFNIYSLVVSSGSQAITATSHTAVTLFTLWLDMVSTISGEIYASGPRLSSGPVQSIVTLQPHCCIFCNAASIVTLRHLYSSDTITIYRTSPLCPAEILHCYDHLLDFSLSAESSFVKLSFKATTHLKIDFLATTSPLRFHHTTPSQASTVLHRIDTTVLPPLSLSSELLQECGPARSSRYYITAASPSQYAISSIDGFSQSRLYDPPPLSSSQELLYKSVDSPDLISTTSPLRLHYIMPSQASTVLHIVGTVSPSPELLSSTKVPGLLAIKTLWLGSSTSISIFLRFFERGF
ncbi:hypothetical protein DY000_02008645 [Brassica cretica]|uniref:Uncharacterized protein n=1 Tax=Brassica cretica TaxID=69181 RepID=A0ABQ7C0E7_BRACR|nr:hypothetical protein DY000_02008645 [Brassica cretica]